VLALALGVAAHVRWARRRPASALKGPVLLDAMVGVPPVERRSMSDFKRETDEEMWVVTGSDRTR
jgi:hypothetical protein